MNGLSASILIFLIIVVLFARRRCALLAMVAGTLYLTQQNAIELLGFNMFAVRFLEIAGFARVIARREFSIPQLNEIDRAFVLLYLFMTVVFLLRSNEGQAYAIGVAVDAVLTYFTFRGLIENIDDLRWLLRAFVILVVPYVAVLLGEMLTSQNAFTFLGGQPITANFREGRIRCIGSFRNPSILGSLGASFLPLYIGLGFSKSNRSYAIAGIVLCLAIIGFSNSGGPLAFAGFGVVGWTLWICRDNMRIIRRLGAISFIAIALAMKAPVWYLPTRISFLTGGDAWHRSYLMDVATQHIREWWLWGMPISNTRDWFPYVLVTTDAADITNQFISFGLGAGLMAIALFIRLLIKGFKCLGRKLSEVRRDTIQPCGSEYLLWGLGVMLAGHIINFTAISYFDQFYVIWFMQLAFISSLTHAAEDFAFSPEPLENPC